MRHIDKVEHNVGKIVVTIREWEGVGTPDYYELDSFTIERALWARDAFNEAVKEAKEYNKRSKESRILTLQNEIQMRQDELKKLKDNA